MLRPIVVLLMLLGAALPAAAQKITVKSATPPAGAQGTLGLEVAIAGSGFGPGAQARFVLAGTDHTDGITVQSTRYVSASQLVATLDIADTATLASFDIKVTLSGAFGWSTAIAAGSPLVFVGETGRNIDGVSAGQVYIYRLSAQ